MSSRIFKWEPLSEEDFTALAEKYPEAVETKTITVRKPVYKVISMLLQCKLDVPGIRLINDAPEEQKTITLRDKLAQGAEKS